MELRVERRDELLENRKLYALVLGLLEFGEGVVRGAGGRLFRIEDFRGGVVVGGAAASR